MEEESGNSSQQQKVPSYEGSNSTLKQYVRDTKEVTRWYSLGVQLGIKTPDLKEIEKNCSSDTERCRIEVIDYWLNNDPEPTQSKIAQAVEDMGGHANIVQTLRASYEGVPQTLKDSGRISCKVLAVKQNGSGGLFQQSSNTDDSSGYQSASLPECSYKQSSSDEQSDSSDEPTPPVDCICGNCDLYTLCTRGCLSPGVGSGIPLPIWNGTRKTFQADYWQLIDYERELTKATKKIVKAFAHLVTDTSKSFAQNPKVGLGEVVLWLRQMEVYMPLTNTSVPLSETMDVDDSKDMQQLFKNLSKYWSWYNYDLIEDLIKEFGTEEDDKNLSMYRNEHYDLYLKNGLPKSQKSFSFGTRCQKHHKKLLMKVDKYWNTIPLGQIRELHHKIAEILKVPSKVLYLSSVSKGCICLEFLVPESMAILLCASQEEALSAVGVFRMECGEYEWQDPDYLGHANRPEEEDKGYEGCSESEGESDVDLTSHPQTGKHVKKKSSGRNTHGRRIENSSKLSAPTALMPSQGLSGGPDVIAGTVQLHSSRDNEGHEHVQELRNVVAKEDEPLEKSGSTREVQHVAFLNHDQPASSSADEHSAEAELSKSKELSLKLVDDFEEKCQMEIITSLLEFRLRKFDEDFKTCLKHAQQERQRVFTACRFSTFSHSHMRTKMPLDTGQILQSFCQVRTRRGNTIAGKTGPGPGLGPGDCASLLSGLRHTMASKTGPGPDPGPVSGELVVPKKKETLIPKPHDEHRVYCRYLNSTLSGKVCNDWVNEELVMLLRQALEREKRLPGAKLVAIMERDYIHVDPPQITQHPTPQLDMVPGSTVTFTVTATGDGPLMYKWQRDCADLDPLPEGMSGETTNTLQIDSVKKKHKGAYTCVVSNAAGPTTSKCSEVTVDNEGHEHVQELRNVVAKEDEPLEKGGSTREVQHVAFLNHDQPASSSADEHSVEAELSKSKELSLKLVDDFEEKCRKETNTSSLEFGPREFDKACTAIKTCLKHVQQRVFNTGFSTIPCSHMCILNITNFRLIANLASLKQLSKSKELSLKLVDDFEEKCRMEIITSLLEFRLRKFDEDFKTCLKHAQQERQRVFTACRFSTFSHSHMRTKMPLDTGQILQSFCQVRTRRGNTMAGKTGPGPGLGPGDCASLLSGLRHTMASKTGPGPDPGPVSGELVVPKKKETLIPKPHDEHRVYCRYLNSTLSGKVCNDWVNEELVMLLRQALEREKRLPGAKLVAIMERDYIHVDPPQITEDPTPQLDMVPGSTVKFTVTATGYGPLMYKWQQDGADLDPLPEGMSGETTNTLQIDSVKKKHKGAYTCVVSNAAGPTTSKCSEVTVVESPQITEDPTPQHDVVPGSTVKFTVTATGDGPLMYKWQRDGADLDPLPEGMSGETTNTLQIDSVKKKHKGAYTCVVSNAAGPTTSKCSEVTVGEHIQQTHTTAVQHHGPHRPQTLIFRSDENLTSKEDVGYCRSIPPQAKGTPPSSSFSTSSDSFSVGSSSEQKEKEDSVCNYPRDWTHPGVLVSLPLGKHLIKGSKGNNLEADFKDTFLSTYEALKKKLHALCCKYGLPTAQELDKVVCVFGHFNSGKSTLLGSLLNARLLPPKEGPEIGPNVFIKHSQVLLVPSTASATNQSFRSLKYAKEQPGVIKEAALYRILETLNTDFCNGDQYHKDIPKSTLVTGVPFLADAPPEWKLSLVDTPGFAPPEWRMSLVDTPGFAPCAWKMSLVDTPRFEEFYSCLKTLDREVLNFNSTWILDCTKCHTKANTDFLRFILQETCTKRQKVYIAVTHFERNMEEEFEKLIVRLSKELSSEEARGLAFICKLPVSSADSKPLEILQRMLQMECISYGYPEKLAEVLVGVGRNDLAEEVARFFRNKDAREVPALTPVLLLTDDDCHYAREQLHATLVIWKKEMKSLLRKHDGHGTDVSITDSRSYSSWNAIHVGHKITTTELLPLVLPIPLTAWQDLLQSLLLEFDGRLELYECESPESYYFFPALHVVQVDRTTDVWQNSGPGQYQCGLSLQCFQEGGFLPPQFLQVLLRHLAFSFAFAHDTSQSDEASLLWRRRWKNGILWPHIVETIVDVSEQNKCILLLMSCPEGEELHLHSLFIPNLLEAKEELCPKISTNNVLMDPSNLTSYPLPEVHQQLCHKSLLSSVISKWLSVYAREESPYTWDQVLKVLYKSDCK